MDSIIKLFETQIQDSNLLKNTKRRLFRKTEDKIYCIILLNNSPLKAYLNEVLEHYYIPDYTSLDYSKTNLTLEKIEEITLQYRLAIKDIFLKNKTLYDDDPLIRTVSVIIAIIKESYNGNY